MLRLKQIRDQITASLIAANIPGVGPNVFPSRARKIWPEEENLLLVYTQNSDFDDEDTAPIIYKVDTDVVVQVIVQQAPSGQDLEDQMDQITEFVVRDLLKVHGIDGPFGGTLEWIKLKNIRPTLSAEGEVLKYSQDVTFSGQWKAIIPDTVPGDDFSRMGTTMGPPVGANAADLDVTFISDVRTP